MTVPGADGATVPVVVVPCYNEARRLDERAFTDLAATGAVRLLFVDDGSTDATAAVLARLAQASAGVEVFSLDHNAGKAEAVRRGMLVAIRGGAVTVGYYDADLATPPGELVRLATALGTDPTLTGVLGCRVARMGSAIERHALRHYLGRTYATVASWALGITVYDTQCGAKLFRVSDALVGALAEPFRSSWAFDVELLDRLVHGTAGTDPVPTTAFLEVPLVAWHDVRGSKLSVHAAAAALRELLVLGLRRRRGAPRHQADDGGSATVMVPRLPGRGAAPRA
ncbi:MAG: glycosyltransferase, partial [Acidimicrobiales bacterium]